MSDSIACAHALIVLDGNGGLECKECDARFVPESRLDRYQEALTSILTWANAYPLQVFPEPDFKKAHEVLTAAGLTLDAISGSNMRHALVGVGNIAREALK